MANRTPFSLLYLLLITILPGTALAKDEIYTSLFSNKALGGYDTVAYFTEGTAIEGDARFTTQYKGAVWQFKSADNLKLFKEAPERYAPQYGGYCAWAVGHGYTAKGDPRQWSIVDGRLYLNYNASVKKDWLADRDNQIRQGDKSWPAVLGK